MPTDLARLGNVVTQLIAYRGWTSPEKLDESYRPAPAPVGYQTIRRIMKADPAAKVEHGQKLLRLSGMLGLGPTALRLVYKGDIEGLQRLVIPGDDGDAVKQFILDLMDPPKSGRSRRAAAR